MARKIVNSNGLHGRALRLLIALPVLLTAACADGTPAPSTYTIQGGTTPELNIGADGRAYLSWQEQRDGMATLRFATFDGRGWAAPRTVAEGNDWFVNAADFPSITAFGNGVIAAHWLHKTGADTYAYEVRMSLSRDGGATWDAPFTVHDDATPAEHGFVTLLPSARGGLDVVWLDGRNSGGSHEAGPETHGAMSLRHAVIDEGGRVISEEEVDDRSCDCCQTSAVMVSGGLLVAYRDRSETEIRDVVVRHHDGTAWSDPVALDRDHWKIDGCPVNGPSLAAHARTIAVAWFSGASDVPKVLAAFSNDSGNTFTAPVRVDDGRPVGRVDVAVLDDGAALVSWIAMRDEAPALNVRRVDAGGRLGMAETLAVLGPQAANGFPRMTRHGENILVAWTERATDNTKVRATVLPVDRYRH